MSTENDTTCPGSECTCSEVFDFIDPTAQVDPDSPCDNSQDHATQYLYNITCIDTAFSRTVAGWANIATPVVRTLVDGELPPGLSFNSGSTSDTSLIVSGTPGLEWVYSFKIHVEDANGSTGDYEWVSFCVMSVTLATLLDGTKNVYYREWLQAEGGVPPYTFAITSGSLPPGLSMSSDGIIQGFPTAAGDYPITVEATSRATAYLPAHTCSRDYTLHVEDSADPPVTIPTPSAYWKLDSTAWADALGDPINTLVQWKAPATLGSGKISNCMAVTAPSYWQYASLANPSLMYPPAGNGISMAFWYRRDSTGASYAHDYAVLAYWTDADQISFEVFVRGPGGPQVDEPSGVYAKIAFPSGGAPIISAQISQVFTVGTWYFIAAVYDTSTNKLSISINSGPQIQSSSTLDCSGNTAIHGYSENYSIATSRFSIDEYGLWVGTALTMGQIALLYNNGSGKTYPF